MINMPANLPIVSATTVMRERVFPSSDGSVTITVGDLVDPDQIIFTPPPPAAPIRAGIRGRVTRVQTDRILIEGIATIVTGLVGWGATVSGPLTLFAVEEANSLATVPPGAILFVPGPLTSEILQVAQSRGIAGIFAASAPPPVIDSYVQGDCSALIDGTALPGQPLPVSIILAHGFGTRSIAREYWQTLNDLIGQTVLCTSFTDLLHGTRPDLLCSVSLQMPVQPPGDTTLVDGATVWVMGGDHDGIAGTVVRVLHTPYQMPSGIRARAARVRLATGHTIVLPIANLIRII